MNRVTYAERGIGIAALGVVSLLLIGCVKAERASIVDYDAKRDAFRVVTIFTDIAAEDAADMDHLVRQWKYRHHVLLSPFPDLFGPIILSDSKRYADNQYAWFNLADPKQAESPARRAPFDLSDINVHPGEFFLSDSKTLCYFQAMQVPGKIVDALLEQVSKKLNTAVVESVATELKRRREGGARADWDDVRLQLAKLVAEGMEGATAATPTKPIALESPLELFDEKSLKALLKQAAGDSLAYKRSGKQISITFDFSEEDRKQVIATIPFLTKAMGEVVENDAKQRSSAVDASLLSMLKSLAVRGVSDQTVISVELDRFLSTRVGSKPDRKKAAVYAATVASLEGRGIAISSELTLDKVIAKFSKAKE